jgi:hypothetical protein
MEKETLPAIKQDNKSSTSPEASKSRTGQKNSGEDPTLAYLKKHNMPLTRENYLQLAFMGNPPDDEELDSEFESSLPEAIRKKSEEPAVSGE